MFTSFSKQFVLLKKSNHQSVLDCCPPGVELSTPVFWIMDAQVFLKLWDQQLGLLKFYNEIQTDLKKEMKTDIVKTNEIGHL